MLGMFRRFRKPTEPVFDGAYSKLWWRTRDDETSSALPYWETRGAPARKAIAEEIAKLEGRSFLEVGCHSGPNIWSVMQETEFQRIAGTELSPTVLTFARDTLPETVELYEAEAARLPFGDAEFDITLSVLVLVCIGPEEIDASLKEILRVTKRWLVIGEQFHTGATTEDPYPNTNYWIRDYPAILKDRVRLVGVRHLEKADHIGHLDCLMVFEKLQFGGRVIPSRRTIKLKHHSIARRQRRPRGRHRLTRYGVHTR